ncbi:glycosyltransferase family 4 protein [Aureibaculum sp. A20]|uniref:Glycosyltransferase family 4 protein n=1 Tax=Aureibaculum flavum TaxID=2795986 RepID=A0ABS0WKV9_9FLAO|nr:glycosyltransferase family 4 protein [Aureibaculum flavum]MBJ2172613.1 glycosyltransferase family 4 protein [Aureibaculum flavum]
MNKNIKKRVLFTGANGFPFGSAVIQRQIQMAKALMNADFKILVINKNGSHSKNIAERENIVVQGNYHGIDYIYCSLLSYRPDNFIVRNLVKKIGSIIEFFTIFYYRIFKNATHIFNNSINLKTLKYYYTLSKIFKMELVYDYVEIIGSLGNRDKKELEEVKHDFDYQFLNYSDKIIAISNYLENHVKSIDPNKEMIKIPPIIDFSYFGDIKPKYEDVSYFLFCGSAVYMDVVNFIIDAFIHSKSQDNDYHLKLVINGSHEQLNNLREFITEKKCQDNIEVLTKLPYDDLISYYKSARALLIPVSNNVQDNARFPFKICEYTASKRPIITSDSGAITEYFIDGENAFIAKTDDCSSLTNKLNLVIDQPALSNKVGFNGNELGQRVFNFKSYSSNFKELLNK